MANIKDFAVGVVVTAPSPSTSGNTATLRPGEGATMPTPPFAATATPPGQLTTVGTSEKILVTAVDIVTDIITFTRAQAPTTAKSIAVGWIIANAVYTDDIFSSSIVMDETLSGTLNGTNKVFTTAAPFTSILVFKNGITMRKGGSNDFTITGNNQITFATAPVAGTVLTATYIMGAQVMINGSNSLVTDEAPTGTQNGTNKTFTVARAYVGGSLEVFLNGIKQKRVVHFTENPTAATFTLDDAPIATDDLMVNYQYVLGASANADTVDGIHANATPTPNMLVPLDSNGRFPAAVLDNPAPFSVYHATGGTLGASGDSKITFNTEAYDPDNVFDTSTSRMTAPIAGIYHFDTTLFVAAASSIHNVQLRKNGTLLYIGNEFTGNGTTGYVGGTDLQLAAGDYVEVWGYNNTTAKSWLGGQIRTVFSGHYVGAS